MLKNYHQKSLEMCIGLPELIDQIRAHAVNLCINGFVMSLCKQNNIYVPQIDTRLSTYKDYFNREAKKWINDFGYHLGHRLEGTRDFSILLSLFPQYQNKKDLKKYLEKHYDLSILPLNLSGGLTNAVKNNLPIPGYRSKADPYAIKHKDSIITSTRRGGSFYVATRKAKYATYLLTLTVPWSTDPTKGTFLCPIGCTHCYRGIETRNRKNIKITQSNVDLLSSQIREQTEALVKKWQPEVYDVLVSGGEPLLFGNKIWKKDIIDVLKQSPHLKSFRVCTGALALGLFARIDDEFIGLLNELRETTGIQVAINAHIAHPENFTPEMVDKALQLKHAGIRIMPQIPLTEGVNFWNENLIKTIATLRRLSHLSTFIINEPVYKYIVDMQGSISLIQAIRVYRSLFDRHQGESNIMKPISFELFIEGPSGNVNLSYHTLFAIKMNVDSKREIVTYSIPHPSGATVLWQEKLINGINDNPILIRRAITESPIQLV